MFGWEQKIFKKFFVYKKRPDMLNAYWTFFIYKIYSYEQVISKTTCKGVFENYTDIDFFDKYILPLYRTLRMVILRIIRLEIESTQKGLLRIMFFLIRKKL